MALARHKEARLSTANPAAELTLTATSASGLWECLLGQRAPALAGWEVGTAQERTVVALGISHRSSTDWTQIRGGSLSTSDSFLDEISQLLSANKLKHRIGFREGQGVFVKDTARNEDAADGLAARHEP